MLSTGEKVSVGNLRFGVRNLHTCERLIPDRWVSLLQYCMLLATLSNLHSHRIRNHYPERFARSSSTVFWTGQAFQRSAHSTKRSRGSRKIGYRKLQEPYLVKLKKKNIHIDLLLLPRPSVQKANEYAPAHSKVFKEVYTLFSSLSRLP